ncbi:MAG: peptidoglycan-binding protein [bacterium]|nr:peptidoglycan-binding protein [bacterium]
MKNRSYIIFMVAMLYAFSPLWAQAAFNDTTADGNGASAVLTADSSQYIIDSATRVESFTVNASTIEFVVKPGSIISITSDDIKDFTYTDTTCETVQKTCGVSSSQLFIQCSNLSTSHTVTVTPSGTCANGNTTGGGGSGGGGGGGGGDTTPAVTPPATPVVSPQVINTPAVEKAAVTFQFKARLKSGSKGEDVKQLQMKLKELGYWSAKLKITGKFDANTIAAVKKFQKANGIAQVGYVGPATLKALNAVNASPVAVEKAAPVSAVSAASVQFTKAMSVGSKGAEVVALQQLLRQLGYFTYPTDTGTYGAATREAVRKFQKANGIAQVGHVGPATLKALNK